MKISYSAVWQDMLGLMRRHASLAIALAGFFIFLPALLVDQFIPSPEPRTVEEMWPMLREYFEANWHWILLSGLATMLGGIAILMLALGRGGTVGAIIAASLVLLPFYFLASLGSGLIIVAGFIALIVPGIYLLGRLVLTAPVVVAENQRNPVSAIARSWELSKDNGWAVAGFLILVGIAATIVSLVATGLLGLVLYAALPDGPDAFVHSVVKTAFSTAVSVLFVFIYAALYRRLSGADTASAFA